MFFSFAVFLPNFPVYQDLEIGSGLRFKKWARTHVPKKPDKFVVSETKQRFIGKMGCPFPQKAVYSRAHSRAGLFSLAWHKLAQENIYSRGLKGKEEMTKITITLYNRVRKTHSLFKMKFVCFLQLAVYGSKRHQSKKRVPNLSKNDLIISIKEAIAVKTLRHSDHWTQSTVGRVSTLQFPYLTKTVSSIL